MYPKESAHFFINRAKMKDIPFLFLLQKLKRNNSEMERSECLKF